jgi:Pectate lyase superfamily protein
VAILQISRITQRKGLEQDLPQPLAGAEFGWAVDQRRLFIGNGELAEGAPIVGNTEILTEFSDLLGSATAYTYQGDAGGYVVQTGATSGSPVTQSLQSRLDSYAVVTSFGATGDGITDDTAAINRALFQIYCREVNPQIRRSLFFPAGVYLITGTLLIPPYALLYGEGSESSIIQFRVADFSSAGSSNISNIIYPPGVLVKYDGDYYRSLSEVPAGIAINNAVYWQPEFLPEYVIRTSDSLQQVGGNIGTNGGIAPRNVEVANMSIQTLNTGDMSAAPPVPHSISLTENAEQITYQNVNFAGPLTVSDIDSNTDDLSCVRFASSVSFPCTQIKFDNCKFSNASYAFDTDQVVNGVTVSNSYFDTLYQGAVLETNPTGVRFVQNIFDEIYAQGIVFDGTSLNATAYNTFYNVGNSIFAPPGYSIIDIDGDNNVSIGDMFQRTTSQSATFPRINLARTNSIALGMNIRGIAFTIDGVSNSTVANQMNLGNYQRTAGIDSVLADNNSGTLFVVSASTIKAFRVDYTITRGVTFRTGTMLVVNGAVSGFTYTDDYSENATTGITLTATESSPGSNITVAYAATATGTAGTITYSITHLA